MRLNFAQTESSQFEKLSAIPGGVPVVLLDLVVSGKSICIDRQGTGEGLTPPVIMFLHNEISGPVPVSGDRSVRLDEPAAFAAHRLPPAVSDYTGNVGCSGQADRFFGLRHLPIGRPARSTSRPPRTQRSIFGYNGVIRDRKLGLNRCGSLAGQTAGQRRD